jgi:hypothetical protein
MAVKAFTQNELLTDAGLDRLGDFLKGSKGGRATNVEALDGFFAALIAGPETVIRPVPVPGGSVRTEPPRRDGIQLNFSSYRRR